MRLSLTALWALTLSASGFAGQEVAQTPQVFEVASVRQNLSGGTSSSYGALPGARFAATNTTLSDLVGYAYEIPVFMRRFLLLGGGDALMSVRFDIQASAPDDLQVHDVPAMVRHLLVDRFELRVRAETREIPIYALTLAHEGALGPRLRPSKRSCREYQASLQQGGDVSMPTDASGRPWCNVNPFSQPGLYLLRRAGTISELIDGIQFSLDRPIVDRTGLAGLLEWEVAFALSPGLTRDSVGPSIFSAIQSELGLRLEPQTALHDVVVIESAKMPTPN